MCSCYAEVCTHLYVMRAGSHQKCELHNWGDVLWDNLWSDSATGDPGSQGWGVYYRGVSCENCKFVNGLHPGGLPFPVGANSHLNPLPGPKPRSAVCGYCCPWPFTWLIIIFVRLMSFIFNIIYFMI